MRIRKTKKSKKQTKNKQKNNIHTQGIFLFLEMNPTLISNV